ncbi:MAG: SusC/RagA family TonB-linked outer membrane protein [Bacteroidales bacterium]|nr:SusC/RagA family TonB-linked outer membrane protein [Bacteroidales bacterium]
MKRILTTVALLLAVTATVFAQGGYQVKGVVEDAMGPVIGATVMEAGTTNGTSTGLDGDFVLRVSGANATIEISCIGYATQTFKASEVPARILLAEDTHFLDEVVVIGYGTVKKSDLTGSVATVKADEVNKGVITTPADLLRGKSAGVVVTAGSGMPGAGATIRVRGTSSLSADQTPLIVIDGLPVSNDGISGMGDPLSTINPEDIESFTVLKDASSTAIYGSRASNGVIVITTKKGARNASKIPAVAIDYTASVNTVAKYNKLLDADGIRSLIQDFYGANSAAEAHLGTANTNWQKEIYQVAPTNDVNLSLNGRVANIPYRVSGGFIDQVGTLKGSRMDRATLSVNLAPTFFDNHLTVNLNGKGTYTITAFANQDAIGAANHYDPTKPVYDENGLNGFSTWYDESGNINTMATMNPVGLLQAKTDVANAVRFIGNAQFDYKIPSFEKLRLNLNLGIDKAKSGGITELAQGSEASYHNTNQSGGGSHTEYSYGRTDRTLEFYGDYNDTFGDTNLDLMAGYSWQHFYSESQSSSKRISDESSLGESVGKGELYLVSFFGRANYSVADKYLVTATLRADGTSRFQNHKWGIFPSVAFGWNMLKESFMSSMADKLSTLKMRLSWGQTGQQAVGGYYDTFAQFLTTQLGSYYFTDASGNYTNPIAALGYSADLRWETTTTYNLGFDWGMNQDRITASLDLYKRDTKDILNYIPVPALSNLTNYLNTNIGSMTNTGVELDINAVLMETRDISWTAGFNVAYNHNVITKLTAADSDATGVETGGISGGTGNNVQRFQVGQPMNVFYVYQQVYDKEGRPISGVYVDRNNDGQINADDKYFYHKPFADFTFGFNTSYTYKNLTVALNGHASLGNWVYNNVASDTEMLADLWTNSFIGNRLASATHSRFSQAQYLSDYYVRDASFLKLDNLTVSYNFPKLFEIVKDRPAALTVFGTIQNLCTLTRYDGIDPEVYGGIDGTMYPRPRTFVGGVKFNF